jgi:hypothetical protein
MTRGYEGMCIVHRLDFGRGAGPAAAERRGDSAQLRVECSAASAPAVHHAALSPFLDDIGSEAVYSPLRASMRASGAHSSFFGSSRFNGAAAPRISRPPSPELARLTLHEQPDQAADTSLSSAKSLQPAAGVDDCSRAATWPSEAYTASVYESAPAAASEARRPASRLQGICQPEQASVSAGLRYNQQAISSISPQHISAAPESQLMQLLDGLPSKLLVEPRLQSAAGSTQPARIASGLGLAAPGLLAHGSVPVQVGHPQDKWCWCDMPLRCHSISPVQQG